jgi:protein-disulfide isomerase
MKIRWETLATATLLVCALATTGLVVYRQFFAATTGPVVPGTAKPVFIESWKASLGEGRRSGSAAAPVQIVEFADFECPFCATFHQTLKVVRARHPDAIAVSFIHFPLTIHRFAEPAARAGECAAKQGRFEAMQDRLFEGQREFGLKPWSEFATAAGVTDLTAFESCSRREETRAPIAAGRELGRRLDVRATPTVIINGWKLGAPPSEEQLDKMVMKILDGESPIADAASF